MPERKRLPTLAPRSGAPRGRVRWSRAGQRKVLCGFFAGFLTLACALPLPAWGRKVKLARKFRPGQTMVYETKMQTHAQVSSNPPGLQTFLPPVPEEFALKQQNTFTVREVHPDGGADIENHFDTFEFQSDLPERASESLRDSAKLAEEEFSRQVAGRTLTAHYDRTGRLAGFEGADALLGQVEASVREPVRQVLRLFLEQMGGYALYPDHPVKRGEEWKQKFSSQATAEYPFAVTGESILRYSGKTKYHGVKAAIIESRLTNTLTPGEDPSGPGGPLAQLEAMGLGLEIRIEGQGQGKILVALDDGRILQNHSTVVENLSARLKARQGGNPPPGSAKPITLTIDSQTSLEVDGVVQKGHPPRRGEG